MPHFTLQIGPQGPLLDAFASVSEPRRVALQASKLPVPNTVQIRALVDTGASGTCIDPSILSSLGLTPTGSVRVNTPSTGGIPYTAAQYDIAVIVPSANPSHPALMLPSVPVIASELLQLQGFHALIGRDVLSRCVLHYNGTMRLFTLAY